MPSKFKTDCKSYEPMNVITFDIGGTWFRSGIVTADGRLQAVARHKALNYRTNLRDTPAQLQQRLVDYLVDEAHRLAQLIPTANPRLVGISMGAAINGHSGLILDSGPLWGPRCESLDLVSALRNHEPDFDWKIVNDITAALLYYVSTCIRDKIARISLITVSTGIGLRTYDSRLEEIPLALKHGLQGEIGHIPIDFQYESHHIDLECDCGGSNHLNAFCSGRGIEALLRVVPDLEPARFRESLLCAAANGDCGELSFVDFAKAIAADDDFAMSILDAVTLPLAKMLINLFTVDPEVERVVLTGGVVHTIGQDYLDSLLNNLDSIGLYQITSRDPSFFRRRITIWSSSEYAELLGAALYARSQIPAQPDAASPANRTWLIETQLPTSYKIVEAPDLLAPESRLLLLDGECAHEHPLRRLIVIDEQVYRLYGRPVREYFRHHQVDHSIVPLRVSEQTKTMESVYGVIEELVSFGILRRRQPIIAIGGGVLLDIVGTAASLYRRGIPYVRVPTTLVSLIDAALGAKVGVNFRGRKSRLGSYHTPVASFLDKSFLKTLDVRQIRNGMAEILKVAIIKDSQLFTLLERNGSSLVSNRFQSQEAQLVIRRAVGSMLEELETNLWEHKLERLMDFGHSFSPAIEMADSAGFQHGEAVAVDMAISTELAFQRNLLNSKQHERVLSVFRELGLPIIHPVCRTSLLTNALQDTVRHRDGFQRLPLPIGIGSGAFINDISSEEISTAISTLSGRIRE